jgi:phosphatidylinositol alpha-1,6-mannosyltransferase
MKICDLNNDLSEKTGAGQFCRSLLRALTERDSPLDVAVLVSSSSGDRREQVVIPKHFYGWLSALPALRRAIRESEVVHALDGWPHGVLAAIANIGIGRPLIITAIGTGAIQPLYRWNAFLLRWAYRRANRLCAISDYTRREILKKVPGLLIEVVPHGVDTREFAAPAIDSLSPAEVEAIRAKEPYILSVGAPKPRKGLEDSIRAFASIRKKFPEYRYIIVSEGAGRYASLIRELHLEGAITFVKHVSRPHVIALYQRAKLFILMPKDDQKDVEGFGLAFLEAAAAGLPVIGTKESGAQDAIADGKNGFLVAPEDADEAARHAIALLESPDTYEVFRKASREFAAAMSWHRAAESYETVYQLMQGEK